MFLKNSYLKTKNYLALDIPFYLKNGSWVIGNKTVVQLTNLLIAILFTRLAAPELFGNYKFILAILSLLSIFSLPGFKQALFKYVADGHDYTYRMIKKAILKWSMVGSIVIILISYYYLNFKNNSSFSLIFLAATIFFPFLFLDVWRNFLTAKLNFKKLFIFNLTQSAFLFFAVASVLIFSKNLLLLLISYVAIISLTNIIFNSLIEKQEKISHQGVETKKAKKYGRFLNFLQIINLGYQNLDKILLTIFLGPQNLAIYVFTIIIPRTLKEYVDALFNIIVPKLVKMDEVDIKRKIRKILPLVIIASILMSFLTILIIPYLINFLFTKKYSEAIAYAQLFSLILVFTPSTNLIVKYALAKEKKNTYSVLNNYSQFIAIFLYFVLIPVWGIQGAIYSILITNITQFFLGLYYLKS